MTDSASLTARLREWMEEARQSHVQWAEHLEAHAQSGVVCEQCAEKPYKMDAAYERMWVDRYDKVIAALSAAEGSAPPAAAVSDEQLARLIEDVKAGADRRAAWDSLGEDDRYTLYDVLLDELKADALSAPAPLGEGQEDSK